MLCVFHTHHYIHFTIIVLQSLDTWFEPKYGTCGVTWSMLGSTRIATYIQYIDRYTYAYTCTIQAGHTCIIQAVHTCITQAAYTCTIQAVHTCITQAVHTCTIQAAHNLNPISLLQKL